MIDEVTLHGKYICLEPLKEEHRAALKTAGQDERIWTYNPSFAVHHFDHWFDKAVNKNKSQQVFAVRSIATKNLIGSTRYYFMDLENKRLAIGYTWYQPDTWGTAVNPECKYLLLQYAFEILKINRIEFFIDARNAHSYAALKKLGAKEEGILRRHMVLVDGHVRDSILLSIIDSEWATVAENLLKRIPKVFHF